MLAFYPTEGAAEIGVAGVDYSTCELFGKVAGDGGGFGADFGAAAPGERDRLVGGSSGPVAGETPDCGPEPLGVGLVRDGGDEGPPSRTGGGFGEGVDLRVEDADSRIGRVQGPAGIALTDEPLNLWAGGWTEILPEPGRNGAFGCLEKDPIEIIDG